MPEIKQMVEWLECGKHEERPRTNAMIDAVIAALEKKFPCGHGVEEWMEEDECPWCKLGKQSSNWMVEYRKLKEKYEKAALEEKGNPLYMHNWLKDDAVCYDLPAEEIIQTLAEENSAMEKEINRLQAALEGPGAEERKELVYHFDKHISFIIGGKDACPTCVKIRALLLGKGAGE